MRPLLQCASVTISENVEDGPSVYTVTLTVLAYALPATARASRPLRVSAAPKLTPRRKGLDIDNADSAPARVPILRNNSKPPGGPSETTRENRNPIRQIAL
jgi:hypothetical protein